MRLLFGFLLFCINTSGQDIFLPKDSSFVKLIEDLPSQEPFDTSRSYHKAEQKYVYIISTKDLSDIFGYEISTKYWEFNFADYHILAISFVNIVYDVPTKNPAIGMPVITNGYGKYVKTKKHLLQGRWQQGFTIFFARPKNTILMDKYKDPPEE
jgi:hypothetical protein